MVENQDVQDGFDSSCLLESAELPHVLPTVFCDGCIQLGVSPEALNPHSSFKT